MSRPTPNLFLISHVARHEGNRCIRQQMRTEADPVFQRNLAKKAQPMGRAVLSMPQNGEKQKMRQPAALVAVAVIGTAVAV